MDPAPQSSSKKLPASSVSRSLWRRLAQRARGRQKRRFESTTGSGDRSQHYTINQEVARQRYEQLKLFTKTDFSIIESAETYRVSNFLLFESNIRNTKLYLLVTCIFLLSDSLTTNCSLSSFLLVFTGLFWICNHHLESYQSFIRIRDNVKTLSHDTELRGEFLKTHLGYSPSNRLFTQSQKNDTYHSIKRVSSQPNNEVTIVRDGRELSDTLGWLNKIIAFFWPYLSQVIHYELDEFFRNQIESGSLARSERGIKRLFYAVIRQLDTNILVIERCQLGHRAPRIRAIQVFEENSLEGPKNTVEVVDKIVKNKGLAKTISYNIDLAYNGDMNIAFIYKYFCCCSSRLGLKDVFLRSKARISLGPIESDLPLIEKVSFTLLELPDFGYKGIALVELAELRIARGAINKLIVENLLYPRVITVSIEDLFNKLKNGPQARKQTDQHDNEVRAAPPENVSLWTRFAARIVLCSCMCSNICLRCCQNNNNNKVGGGGVHSTGSDETIANYDGKISLGH